MEEAAAAGRQVEEFVHSRVNFERLPTDRYDLRDFKLDRMRALLARLGDPQQALPAVHVAGTKGKGSTAVMIAAMLQAAGHRVGLFTSPHIHHFGERMTVDGVIPAGQQLLEALEVVRPFVQTMDEMGPSMRPTFFEVLTALAWVHFARQAADLVVLEVGLGGRLDATNVCRPLVSVITSISHDHQRLLGHTLPEIAAEKAGIIRTAVPVLSGVTQAGPADVIGRISHGRGAPLFELGRDLHFEDWECGGVTPLGMYAVQPVHTAVDRSANPKRRRAAALPIGPRTGRHPTGSTINVTTPWRSHAALHVPLPGRHQAANAALALAAVDWLNERGHAVPQEAIATGLASVRWPLRVEVVRERPLTVVDAAHNDASAEALVAALAEIEVPHRLLIFATSRDKDVRAVLGRLAPHFDHVILTRFVNNPRAVTLTELQAAAAEVLTTPFETAEDPIAAWDRALRLSSAEDLICATGSFFLAAEVRDVVLGNEHDSQRIDEQGPEPAIVQHLRRSHESSEFSRVPQIGQNRFVESVNEEHMT